MQRHVPRALALGLRLLLLLTLVPRPGEAPAAAQVTGSFVSRSGSSFALNGRPFYFSGTNAYYLPWVSRWAVDDALQTAVANRFTVVRVFGMIDIGNQDGSNSVDGPKDGVYFQYWNGSAPAYNDGPDGLQRLDYVIYRAGQLGLKVLIPFTDNWYWQGGMDQYVRWRGAQYHDDFYTDPTIKQWYRSWIAHLANRVNTYSGVAYRNDPAIFGWQLANEPECFGNGSYDTSPNCGYTMLTNWATEMSAFVKTVDPNHLVGVGDQGFYCDPNGTDHLDACGHGIDTLQLARIPTVDFMGFHLYDAYNKTREWETAWIQRHITDGHRLGKPVVLDEFGWKDQATRAAVYQVWTSAILTYGGDGDMFWQYGGRFEDGSLFPDDGYAVYCPGQFCTLLAGHAVQMDQRNHPGVTPTSVLPTATSPVRTPTRTPTPPSFPTATRTPTSVPFSTPTATPSTGGRVGQRYAFPWYDGASTDGNAWLLIANPNPFDVPATVTIGGALLGSYTVPAARRLFPNFPGVVNGPALVDSGANAALIVSQRVLLPSGGFNELAPATGADMGNDLYFAWYDSRFADGDWLVIANPSATAGLQVDVSIGGVPMGRYPIAPGGRVTPSYPGVSGGPVRLTSAGGQTFYATQRVLYRESFSEHPAVASGQLATEWWGAWYDSVSFTGDWLILANPGPVPAQASIYIGGVLRQSLAVPPAGTVTPSFPGLAAGPIRVVVTNGVPILAGHRSVRGGSFHETLLTPASRLGGIGDPRYLPWYDSISTQGSDWVVIANAGAAPITAEVRIAGALRGTYPIGPGGVVFPTFAAVRDGPVEIRANGPFLASQRTLHGAHFSEFGAQPLR